MTTLEARIAEAISWKKLPWGGQDKFVQLDANASHAVAKLLAPVIREAQAEAWEECVHVYDSMVCLDCEPNAPTNPYRADNLATP